MTEPEYHRDVCDGQPVTVRDDRQHNYRPFGWWCPECDRVFDSDALEHRRAGSDKLLMYRVIA